MQVGICKIIPPEGWKPCQGPVEEKDVTIRGPVSQELTGSQGLYQAHMQKKTPMSLQHKYKAYATDPDRRTPLGACPETIERKFWQSSHLSAPIYGADTEATFFDDTCEVCLLTLTEYKMLEYESPQMQHSRPVEALLIN